MKKLTDDLIASIAYTYANGRMSISDLAMVTGLTRLQINWCIDEAKRRNERRG